MATAATGAITLQRMDVHFPNPYCFYNGSYNCSYHINSSADWFLCDKMPPDFSGQLPKVDHLLINPTAKDGAVKGLLKRCSKLCRVTLAPQILKISATKNHLGPWTMKKKLKEKKNKTTCFLWITKSNPKPEIYYHDSFPSHNQPIVGQQALAAYCDKTPNSEICWQSCEAARRTPEKLATDWWPRGCPHRCVVTIPARIPSHKRKKHLPSIHFWDWKLLLSGSV